MDLAGYIREHKLLDETVITDITNAHLVKKFTFFEELYVNGNKYGVEESKALEWAVAAGGPGYEVITTTKGFQVNGADYDKLGGVSMCIKLKVLCVRRRKHPLCIITQRPDDSTLILTLNKALGEGTYSFGVCSKSLWDSIYQSDVEPLYIEARARHLEETVMQSSATNAAARDSEARQIYNHIIMHGIQHNASDIHLIPCDNECRVVYRIDGENHQKMRIGNNIAERIANILTVDGRVAAKAENATIDGKIHYFPQGCTTEDQARDLRFSIMPTRRGKDVNVRFLNNTLYTFEGLGMSKENIKAYERILNMPQGLIMQVGPTGSGKSTTLYAGLNYIHENSLRNIITVEDPVEILMNGITQVDVKEEAGLTFAKVSRQFLRHDVDVGVIGEIRDEETALEAVRAATTGHLVISSLHTNDSLGVLERLIRLGVDPYTLSEVIVAIMGQRLVRRLCPYCKEAYTLAYNDPRLTSFNLSATQETRTFYRAVGCEHCNNYGYKGRIAVNEILLVDRELRNMIQLHETRKNMEAYLKANNFKTMFMDARDKVLDGVTSLEELEPMMNDTLAYK